MSSEDLKVQVFCVVEVLFYIVAVTFRYLQLPRDELFKIVGSRRNHSFFVVWLCFDFCCEVLRLVGWFVSSVCRTV